MAGQEETSAGDVQLRKGVGLAGVVMFGAGTAIGVSIFSVLAPAAKLAGSGLLLAVVLAALPMVLFATIYAFLSSALPKSGASYEWPRTFIHPLAGFLIAWLRILSNVGAIVVLAMVLVNYLQAVVDLPLKPTMAAAISAVFLANYLGVAVAARVQILMMVLLLGALGLFVWYGAPAASADNIGSLLAPGGLAIASAVPLMISLFLGIESSAEIGEEVHDARRTIPLGIGLAVLLTTVVYVAVATTALGLLGPGRLAQSTAPILDAAKVAMGDLATPVILGAACISILKTLNATAMVFSRSLFAMGRSGALPPVFASIHPRFGSPQGALLFAYAAAMLGLFMPPNLTFLLLAVNIPTMLKYMASSLCAIVVARRRADIHARASFRPKSTTIVALGWAAIASGIAILVAGWSADWQPYALIGGWAVVGVFYWALVARRYERTAAEA